MQDRDVVGCVKAGLVRYVDVSPFQVYGIAVCTRCGRCGSDDAAVGLVGRCIVYAAGAFVEGAYVIEIEQEDEILVDDAVVGLVEHDGDRRDGPRDAGVDGYAEVVLGALVIVRRRDEIYRRRYCIDGDDSGGAVIDLPMRVVRARVDRVGAVGQACPVVQERAAVAVGLIHQAGGVVEADGDVGEVRIRRADIELDV